MRLNPQAQLPRAQQGQRQRQHDSTRPQLEKLPCSVVCTGDGHSSVLQDSLADDNRSRSSDVERIFPSIDRAARPLTYAGLKASYYIMLFTTPYIGYSFLLSALYIFTLRPRRSPKPQPLPLYPVVESRNQLSVVIGEIHNPRLPVPAENPTWLIIPERGLFTGTIMIGAPAVERRWRHVSVHRPIVGISGSRRGRESECASA